MALLTDEEVAVARQRRLVAMTLQEIAGNPLDANDIATFEMFEREKSNALTTLRSRRDVWQLTRQFAVTDQGRVG
jgi:hypothetical protein